MPEDVLSVKFIGEDGQLTKTLGALEGQLKRFKKGVESAGSVESINRLNRAIEATKARMDAINSVSQRPFQGITRGGGAATQTMTDFSRIIQDSPYGIIGISNNIEQLGLSLRHLSVEAKASGTTVGALLTKQLVGGGGLFLALSLVTSALSFATMGMSAWTRGFGGAGKGVDSLKKKLKEAKEANENFLLSLKDPLRANIIGSQDAQKELLNLKLLYEASQNLSLALKERKKAVDALQNQFPSYFKNIKDEEVLAGNAEQAYKDLSNAILQSARVRAAQELIVELQKELLVIEERTVKATTKEYEAFVNLNSELLRSQQIRKAGKGKEGQDAIATSVAERALNKYNDTLKESTQLSKDQFAINDRIKNLIDQINQNVLANGVKVLIDPNPDVKEDKLKKDTTRLFERVEEIIRSSAPLGSLLKYELPIAPVIDKNGFVTYFEQLEKQTIEFKDRFENALSSIKAGPSLTAAILPDVQFDPSVVSRLSETLKFQEAGEKIGAQIGQGFDKIFGSIFESSLDKAFKRGLNPEQIKQFQSNLTLAANLAADALEGVGSAFDNMGQALVNGQNIAQAFGNTMKQVLAQIVGQLLKTIALQAIASLLTGGATAAAAGLIGKAVSLGAGMAQGGIVPPGFPNDTFPARLSSGEAVIPLNKLGQMIGGLRPGTASMGKIRLRGRDMELQRAREGRAQRKAV